MNKTAMNQQKCPFMLAYVMEGVTGGKSDGRWSLSPSMADCKGESCKLWAKCSGEEEEAAYEPTNGMKNPFPEAFYPGEETAPDDIWEPMFTQNTLNGWAHDAWGACAKTYEGYLSPLDVALAIKEAVEEALEHPAQQKGEQG